MIGAGLTGRLNVSLFGSAHKERDLGEVLVMDWGFARFIAEGRGAKLTVPPPTEPPAIPTGRLRAGGQGFLVAERLSSAASHPDGVGYARTDGQRLLVAGRLQSPASLSRCRIEGAGSRSVP